MRAGRVELDSLAPLPATHTTDPLHTGHHGRDQPAKQETSSPTATLRTSATEQRIVVNFKGATVYVPCDAPGCNARAYKEILTPQYTTLWACNHHAAEWVDVPEDVRFQLEYCELAGLTFKRDRQPTHA